MKKVIITIIFIISVFPIVSKAQTTSSGIVLNYNNKTISDASLHFKNSNIKTYTNKAGVFYLESGKNHDTLVIMHNNYKTKEIVLQNKYDLDLKIFLESISSDTLQTNLKADEFPKDIISLKKDYVFTPLDKDELGISKIQDTVNKKKNFNYYYFSLVKALGDDYIPMGKFEYGPLFSSININGVEGVRLQTGGRIYLGSEKRIKLQAYMGYGIKDNKFKYGLSGKVLLEPEKRIIAFAEHRNGIEEPNSNITESNIFLSRGISPSTIPAIGNTKVLTSLNSTAIGLEIEAFKNIKFTTIFNYRTIKSASEVFNIDYYTDKEKGITKSEVAQTEISISVDYTPTKKTTGTGVDRKTINDHPYLYANYSYGIKGLTASDFDYKKVQLFYRHPIDFNNIGKLTGILEIGKTFGEVPLVLMNTVPGNSSYFFMENSFNMMNYYEFTTDQYLSLKFEHNFKGYLFSKIPLINKLNLHEIIGIRGIYGTISDKNTAINASDIIYRAPEKVYWECHLGISNIFEVLGVAVIYRGNYMEIPKAKRFGFKFFATFNF